MATTATKAVKKTSAATKTAAMAAMAVRKTSAATKTAATKTAAANTAAANTAAAKTAAAKTAAANTTAGKKTAGKKTTPQDVEAYLATVPAAAVPALRALRKAIREAAPDAEEVIAMGVPTYLHRGRLVSFAATPKHCAFYVMSPGPVAARKAELSDYDTAPSAIRFSSAEPLPAALIKAIVRDRLNENDSK